jgi:hypothetical protein
VARVVPWEHVIRDEREWSERAIGIAGWLAGEGAPVIAPSALLPPGPHVQDDSIVSFWTLPADAVRDAVPEPQVAHAAGAALRDCRAALARYPHALPVFDALTETEALISTLVVRQALPPADAALAQAAIERLVPPLMELRALLAPVHGDANLYNAIATPGGVLWSAWESACVGSSSWDAACLRAAGHETPPAAEAAEAALAGLAEDDDPAEVAFLTELRELQTLAWTALRATSDPSLAGPLDAALARLRVRGG